MTQTQNTHKKIFVTDKTLKLLENPVAKDLADPVHTACASPAP
jgi:hypothetical protein